MPFPDQALQIQQSLPRNPELVEQQIAVLEARCPLVPFADAAAIESDRAQVRALGESWLSTATSVANEWEGFLVMQRTQHLGATATAQASGDLMSTFGRMYGYTERTLRGIEAANRAIWQRELLLQSGRPFFEVWPGPFS